MKAAFYAANGPARDVLEVGELPDPVAAPGQVLVRIAVSGINPSDVKTRQGTTARPFTGGPRIPHNDGSGTVVSVGEGVDPGRIGRRVWVHNTGVSDVLGTAAELVAVNRPGRAAMGRKAGQAGCWARLRTRAATPLTAKTALMIHSSGA